MTFLSLDRRLLGIAAAIGAISAVGSSLSLALPLLSILLDQRGVSPSLIGLNTAVAGIASLLSTPFVPYFAHRFGATRLLAAMLALASLVFPLFYVFDHYGLWMVLRFVFHAAINIAFVLSEFWINALAPPHKRGLVMGIYATVLSLGFAAGPVILGMIGTSGFAPFFAGTLVFAASLLPVLLALSLNPPMEEKPKGSFLKAVRLSPLATFAALTMGATESGVFNFIALYGLKIGLDQKTAALLVSALALGNVVSQVPLGMIADRVDRRKLLLSIALAGTMLALLIPLASSFFPALFVLLMFWGGIVTGLYTVGLTHLGARFKGTDLAFANAAFVFMYAAGMLAGPTTLGLGMELWTPHGFAIAAAGFTGAYALLAIYRIWMRRDAPEGEMQKSDTTSARSNT